MLKFALKICVIFDFYFYVRFSILFKKVPKMAVLSNFFWLSIDQNFGGGKIGKNLDL